MDPQTVLFYIFSALTIASATLVITARNPVHSALWLVLSFFSAAAIWLLLKAEFLAITLVLVYVGAVMVLFLFVVMMLDINIDKVRAGFWANLPVALVVAAAVVLELFLVIWHSFKGVRVADAPVPPPGVSNTQALGRLIYTDYVYPFEIAAVVLLVAIVAAIALTLRRRKDTRYNDPSRAVRTRREDRVRLVKVAPSPRPDVTQPAAGGQETVR